MTLLAGAVALLPHPAHSQVAPAAKERLTPARVAMWVLAGAAVGSAAYALRHSERAADNYASLRSYCAGNSAACVTGNGRYTDARAEGLYQSTLSADRRARIGIVTGQIALGGSVLIFVRELRARGGRPRNIPYEPPPAETVPPPSAGPPEMQFYPIPVARVAFPELHAPRTRSR